ncbi:MAG: hypothetical protein LQ347_005393 [Umbilicaria vellea]|nr:MAG: hypothetical protein LQ347_005393 [Umbilicaria vellea]
MAERKGSSKSSLHIARRRSRADSTVLNEALQTTAQRVTSIETEQLPEITEHTHVLALLGVEDTPSGQDTIGHKYYADAAGPENDGWFVADFALLNHLFHGLGKSQKWLTCINDVEYVDKYSRLSHGNPHRERRLVLCKGQSQLKLNNLVICETKLLRESFLKALTNTIQDAAPNDSVLVLCFAHGDRDAHGLVIGVPSRGSRLTVDDMHEAIQSGRAAKPSFPVTLFLTSCFSGQFTLERHRLESTILAATTAVNVSRSWHRSASGQFAGSIYVSGLLKNLSEDEIKSQQYDKLPGARHFHELKIDMKATIKALYQRRGISIPTFAAQGGAAGWLQSYPDLTGLAYGEIIRANLARLPILPPNPENSADPGLPEPDYSEYRIDFSTGNRAASINDTQVGSITVDAPPSSAQGAMRGELLGQLDLYTHLSDLDPRAAARSDEIEIINLGTKFRNGKACVYEMDRLGRILAYRNLQASFAMDWAKDFTSKPPSEFAKFDVGNWEEENEEDESAVKRMLDVDKLITTLQLFPPPPAHQGVPWTKPELYLACALADKGLSGADLREALGPAVKCQSIGQ